MRAALLLLVACGTQAPEGAPERLAAYLHAVAARDPAARREIVDGWRLDRAAWDRAVSPLYRSLYDDYVAAFAVEAPAIAAQLRDAPVTARKHFAGDPRLTGGEARVRWALPVLAPTLVAELGGAPIDAVFVDEPGYAGRGSAAEWQRGVVDDRGQWRALIGLDRALRARIAAYRPDCAERITHAGPTGRCMEAGAAVADAALRITGSHSSPELDHVCRLAEALCGTALP